MDLAGPIAGAAREVAIAYLARPSCSCVCSSPLPCPSLSCRDGLLPEVDSGCPAWGWGHVLAGLILFAGGWAAAVVSGHAAAASSQPARRGIVQRASLITNSA